MGQYRAIVFDFDMTLADSAQVIIQLLNQTAVHFGYAEKPAEAVMPIVGNTHEKMLSYVTGVTDEAKILEMRTYYRAISRKEMPGLTTFFPDVPDMLRAIQRAGLPMGLVSLKLRDILMACLHNHHLAGYFQSVIGCEEVPAPKPDPSGLLLMAKNLGKAPADCLYIGDSLVDQQAAIAAGMPFAAMLKGGTRMEQFDPRHAIWFFHAPGELAAALDAAAPPFHP